MMVSSRHSTWQSRLAALALLVAVLSGLVVFVAAPVVNSHRRLDDRIAANMDLLARYRAIAARQPALQAALNDVRDRRLLADGYLPGETDSLAAVKLQELVTSVIDRNGAELLSAQILPASATERPTQVSVRVQLTATMLPLARILHALESNDTYLRIENLEIATRGGIGNPTREDFVPTLAVRFDVTGFLRPEIG